MYDTLLSSSADSAEAFKDKHLWVKKATGIGASEFFLRLMVWLCVYDNSYRNSQMVIVTGQQKDFLLYNSEYYNHCNQYLHNLLSIKEMLVQIQNTEIN